jgi:flagellar basal-body rod modification protein FlgD
MAVDAIGGSVGSGVNGVQNTGLQESDFIQLFLTQLTFQDPLQPVDNAQFLAQLAQFTSIEQNQVISDNITGLLSVQASSQALSLLGHTVEVTSNGSTVTGQVSTVQYNNGSPLLTVTQSDGTLLQSVDPTQVTLVQGGS